METRNPLSRREALRALLALGGAAALSACQRRDLTPAASLSRAASAVPSPSATVIPRPSPSASPQPSASPAPSPSPTAAAGSAVALVRTGDRAAGVRQAAALLGLPPLEGQAVFLKPNFNSADPAPGSTHPDVLRALVEWLRELGAGPITVGDRSGMGGTRAVMEALGVFALASELGFDVAVLDELGDEAYELIQPPGSHWRQGFPFARAALQAGAVVTAGCLKTHRFGGHFTHSLKNSVGLVAKHWGGYNYMSELHDSPDQRRMIAEINAAYQPALVVLDGVQAFISGGPDRGETADAGVILAGTDRVALDAAGLAVLRLHGCQTEAARGAVWDQEQIARAVELGLGAASPTEVTFLTADGESAAYAEQLRAWMG